MSTAQEIGTNGNSIEQTPAWKLEGLPGQPIVESSPGKMHFVQLDTLIRDERGKIITAPRRGNIEKLMSEHLGKTIEAVKTYPEKGWSHPNEFEDVVTFRYEGCGRLSLLERRAIGAFAWMSHNYYTPMERREKIVFPTVLNDLPEELHSPRLKVQMWKAFSENKAVQVAAVLEKFFPDTNAIVFEEGDGWFVAAEDRFGELEDAGNIERVETILWMLSDFDVVPTEDGMMTQDFDDDEGEYVHAKAVRAFDAYAAQQRIEDGINAILASLGDVAAPGKVKEPAADALADDKDAHSLPPKPGKKPAPKKTA